VLPGDGLGEPVQAGFRGHIVGPLVDVSGPAVVARDVDDAAPAPLPHGRQGEVGQVEGGVQVGGQGGVPVVDGDVLERLAEAAGHIGNGDVDRAESVNRGGDQGGDLVGVGDVGHHPEG